MPNYNSIDVPFENEIRAYATRQDTMPSEHPDHLEIGIDLNELIERLYVYSPDDSNIFKEDLHKLNKKSGLDKDIIIPGFDATPCY